MLQLETERLYFRRYTWHDLEFVEQLVTNPEVMRYIGNGEAKTMQYAEQLISRMLKQYENFDIYGLHVLVHKETEALIGHAGLVAQVFDDQFEIELGYWIEPSYWQQGYAFEAAEALKRYAIEELQLERFVSAIQVGNEGSQRIAIKNGLQLIKTIQMDDKDVQIYAYETNK